MRQINVNNKTEDIKDDFITVVSHQLRTPIAAIRWALDTLISGRLGRLSAKQSEIVQEAYWHNKFLSKVVNLLLQISRFDSAQGKLKPEFIDLAVLTQKVIKNYQSFANAANCRIVLAASGKLPRIWADPLPLKTVIEALIDNAINYSRGKGQININLTPAGDNLIFKIKDSGIGIPPKQQPLVFTKFFRAKNALRLKPQGLGMDLYLVKKIIDAAGGKINFSSKENQGAIFNVWLPLNKPKREIGPEKKEEKKEPSQETLKKEREFVAITVHELKAPLGSSKWSLETLKSQKIGKLNSRQLDLIQQVYRGNERLLVLVRDLLNLAKLQEGKFEIQPRPILLAAAVGEAAAGFILAAKKKKIKFVWPKGKKSGPKVMADPSRIGQVISNLISNAVKYTPALGKISVNLQFKSAADLKRSNERLTNAALSHFDNKKGYLVVSVKDSGIGISPADQKNLFAKFFRSRKVLSSQSEGTGLGLYITKSIVDLHQGDLWFESQLGRGSTFYFSLPVV